ncbi:MAG: peptidylprolyl isomerase [Luteolibacter sp.]
MNRRHAISLLLGLFLLGSCNAEKPTGAPDAVVPEGLTKVRLKTNVGEILIQLDPEKAPVTVDNFLKYVASKHYDGTVFHRVIDGFMIQGGGFKIEGGGLQEKPTGAGIKNESQNGLKNDRGTIAMARTNDPNSATTQFFINVKDNDSLNFPSMGGYAVFGKVIAGMDVVDKIKVVETGAQDVPVTPIVIESATAE